MTQATDGSTHVASIKIDVTDKEVFAFMRDARNIGQWSLGAYSPVEITTDMHVGDSLIDGERVCIKVESDPDHKIIHFYTGVPGGPLKQLVMCRVVPGAYVDIGDRSCLLSMISWRPADMELQRWQQRCATHEAEMFLIKNRIEQGIAVCARNLAAVR